MFHLEGLHFHQRKDFQKLISSQKLEQSFLCWEGRRKDNVNVDFLKIIS